MNNSQKQAEHRYMTPEDGKKIAVMTLVYKLLVLGFGSYWIYIGRYPLSYVLVGGLGSVVFLEAVLMAFFEKSFIAIFEEKRFGIGENWKNLLWYDKTVLHGFDLLEHELKNWEINSKRENKGIAGAWEHYSVAHHLVMEHQTAGLVRIADIWGNLQAQEILASLRGMDEETNRDNEIFEGDDDEDFYGSRPKV